MSQGAATHLAIRAALAVTLSLAIPAPVRAKTAPPRQETPAPAALMTTMTPAGSASQGARQATSMTEMMGAPGLVPFDVMNGQAGKWMVGYQFMSESMNGSLVGTSGTPEATTLEHYFAEERTNGIGDIELRGMYSVLNTQEPRQWLLLNGGVGLPTGSIDATMAGMRIEYPMQIGSGTLLSAARRHVSGTSTAVGVGRRFDGNRYQLGGSDPMLDPAR